MRCRLNQTIGQQINSQTLTSTHTRAHIYNKDSIFNGYKKRIFRVDFFVYFFYVCFICRSFISLGVLDESVSIYSSVLSFRFWFSLVQSNKQMFQVTEGMGGSGTAIFVYTERDVFFDSSSQSNITFESMSIYKQQSRVDKQSNKQKSSIHIEFEYLFSRKKKINRFFDINDIQSMIFINMISCSSDELTCYLCIYRFRLGFGIEFSQYGISKV